MTLHYTTARQLSLTYTHTYTHPNAQTVPASRRPHISNRQSLVANRQSLFIASYQRRNVDVWGARASARVRAAHRQPKAAPRLCPSTSRCPELRPDHTAGCCVRVQYGHDIHRTTPRYTSIALHTPGAWSLSVDGWAEAPSDANHFSSYSP